MSILKEELITNHLLLDYFDMWDEFDIQKVDDPKTIRYYNLLENHINNQIDATIRWLESDEARDYFFDEAKYQKEILSALEDEWDEILSAKYPSVDALLDEVYRRGKAKGYADMREHIKFSEADKIALNIARNYNYHLIRKIDNDTRSQIKSKITEAVVTGEHPDSVARKIRNVAEEKLHGTNFTPKQRATMIARTEISRVQNTGILQSYINEGYTEVKILTAGDSRVCNLCLRYAFEFEEEADITYDNRGEERTHNIIKLIKGGNYPPFHPLCRCTYLSVWNSKGEPPENPVIINLIPNMYQMLPELEYEKDSSKTVEADGHIAYGVGESLQDKIIFEMKYGVSIYDFPPNSPELKLIKLYSDDGFKYINEYLRESKKITDSSELERLKSKCAQDWNIALEDNENYITFDEALNASRNLYDNYAKELEEDLVVVRRQDKSMLVYADGNIYHNDTFLSTSISGEIYEYGDYVNYIRIPKGTKILYIEGVTIKEKEYELLLPPDIDLHLVEEVSEKLLKWTL